MKVENIEELILNDKFISISNFVKESSVNLKLEGLSLAGSIKIKPAFHMLRKLEEQGIINKNTSIIESSSGNLGLALSVICSMKGYNFTCISDPNISPQTERLIRAYGTNLIIVDKRDKNGGFLATRIELINEILAKNPNLIWLNQYENLDNVGAHYFYTATEIIKKFNRVDYLFIGAGTTGTLGGISKYFREYSPHTKIIAVDTTGSVTFGLPSGKRYIPGLGTNSASN